MWAIYFEASWSKDLRTVCHYIGGFFWTCPEERIFREEDE
jgi:hypothetical protein